MKTFLGDMHDYIYESEKVALKVFSNRKELSSDFINVFKTNEIETIVLTGAGTSNYSAQGVRTFFEKVLKVSVLVPLTNHFIDGDYMVKGKGLFIGISATGSSASTINALDKANSLGMITMALTNELESEVVKHCDKTIFLDHGIEDVSPKSKSFICELVTLLCCALETARELKTITNIEYEEYTAELNKTILNLTTIAIKSDEWFKRNELDLKQCERMILVGYGKNYGILQEGALKILECGRFQTCFYELEEFMHGIYHSIDENCYLLYLGDKSKYYQRMIQLKNYLGEFTSHQYLITSQMDEETEKNLVIDFVESEEFSMIEYIVPCQILAYRIAISKGINPNKPSDPYFHKKMNSKFI
ncbi:SIS domain-containing protein [Anaerorhabdus furcosa]|uniref:SIS domain-containing protein n=1 Tax=Anaerorhabdus furcosa TaxID=118967 RepID=A0A1T4K7I6_9FIRM|nr:SIS domain-containing protein [Anaerorhabdus furcosa]SJZ38307.1 SIS domain-containing protein [Anaerorhabdus furcosa]